MYCYNDTICTPLGSRGAILVKIAIMMVPIIALLSLAIDIGLLIVNRTNLQSAADSASLAAVDQLRPLDTSVRDHNDLSYRYSDEKTMPQHLISRHRRDRLAISFANTKLALLAALKAYSPNWRGINSVGKISLSSETTKFSWYDAGCSVSNGRAPDYGEFNSTCARAGNVIVSQVRGIRCYDSGDRLFCPVENDSLNWFKANATYVELRLAGLPRYFAMVVGANPNQSTIAASLSYLPETSVPICSQPLCSVLVSNFNRSECSLVEAIL
ncbi:MAG TPA: pilus assembly protein TadG-related protein [Oligoflexia bacterium]|nr:pilus assembly protein TadG-related protein [Oligoflexia bacterium]HMP47320.1 pilus assembly protein TadG-related protein [Oligoflexia bacterium]